jgi:GntR family transcriptional regulator
LSASSFSYENLGRLFGHHLDRTHFRLYTHGAIISSIIPHVKIDRSEPLALHEQVAAEIRRAIADGEAAPGERLPPAKDLAAVLGVNSNTVLRALRLLRDEGLLEFRRGRGVSVAGTPERTAVIVRAYELVEFARRQGFRSSELIEIIEGLT